MRNGDRGRIAERLMSVHRHDGDQPDGFDESRGVAPIYWITPEIWFGSARRMHGERFDALAASLVRVASIVALSAGRSGWRYHIGAMMPPIFRARTDNSPSRKRAFASRTSRAARKLPTECASNRRKRARVAVFTN